MVQEDVGEHSTFLFEEVKASVNKMVELLTSFQKKGRLFKILASSLFIKRQGEAENAIQKALMNLQVGFLRRLF